MSATIENIYPLSPAQQGFLFHATYDPESGDYVAQLICSLNSTLNLSAFMGAWQQIMERHQVLRTSFHWEGLSEPMQVVHQKVKLPWQQYDWRALPASEQEERWQKLLVDDRRQGFDVTRAPLMRLTLIRMREDSYRFVWTHHHVLLDGWCMPLLMKEMLLCYDAYQREKQPQLPPARPYADYIEWLQRQDLTKAEAFWRRVLDGFNEPTQLPTKSSGADSVENETRYARETIHLPVQTTEALRSLARAHQLTMNTLVQGAWAVLLSRYSGNLDVMFGTTVSGRPAELAGVETMIGLFINTLPVRVQVPPNAPLLPWLKKLQAQQAEMREYEYSPLVQVQGWSKVARGQQLFESLVVYQNYPVDASLQEQVGEPGAGLEISEFKTVVQTNYALNVGVTLVEDLIIQIGYDTRRVEAEAVKRILTHFESLLESMATASEQSLSSLSMSTERERRLAVEEWNDNARDYAADKCIHELFEAQVERTPEAVALVCGAERLTYAELNRRANQLGHYVRRLGVGPEVRVGLCLERSVEQVVGLLAVLKAGGAYVPLDPEYPLERLSFMMEDMQTSVLLTQGKLVDELPASWAQVVSVDGDWKEVAQESERNITSGATAGNLAYVIYTSGSTGRPKGVMIEHRSLVNLVQAQRQAFGVTPNTRVLQFASIGFDASVSEIFVTLCAGARLQLWPGSGGFSVEELRAELLQGEVTLVTLPPSVLLTAEPSGLAGLTTVVAAGEQCSAAVVRRWGDGRRLLNGYGPTETTVCATVAECMAMSGAVAPIGRAIENVQVYLLDEQQRPVGVGVRGELYIGGAGVGRGYWNRAEQTAERFVPHPFSRVGGERLYRTGDLGRYLEDGQIEFSGRVDGQVKLRGYRIELGEIETGLRRLPGVEEAVVQLREEAGGEPRLVGYVVSETGQELNQRELHEGLRAQLPSYMIPAVLVQLDQWPLTTNGKIDRRALRAPEPPGGDKSGASEVSDVSAPKPVAPRTATEELLGAIWSEVLRVERVGLEDNFFELGGHSLLATQLVSRILETFRVHLPLRNSFESPTIAEQARLIDRLMMAGNGVETPPITRASRAAALPLSFAQQRLWFLNQLEPGSPLYNIPMVVRLRGSLNAAALERTINEIIRRHEVLRTSFVMTDDQPAQVIAPELRLKLAIADLSQLEKSEQETEAKRLAAGEASRGFDLSDSPLLRAQLLRLSTEEHILLFTMHHIISDGWSMSVLVREVSTLYPAFASSQPARMEELPIQYADYALWQRQHLQGEVLEQQLAYWREQLADAPPVLELPTDKPRAAVRSYRGAVESFSLSRELTIQLKQLSKERSTTLFMTLLAAFQTLLYRYSNQPDILVGTPIANRTRGETENLIGFFVNTLVLRSRFSARLSFSELLQQVRKVTLGAYAHQDVPFEKVVEELQPERSLSHTPLFQTMFTMQTPLLPAAELSELRMSAEGDTGEQAAKFDFSLSMMEGEDGLAGAFDYRAELFAAETVQRMIAHFEQVLRAMVVDPGQKVANLELLSAAEREQILMEWNDTATESLPNDYIHQLFAEQVERTPEAAALVFHRELSYRELNSRANQLAHYLQELGVGPEAIVGIFMTRSIEMIVGVLAVLKAGGAYVPLDPGYPRERLSFMLRDAGVKVLLSEQQLAEKLPPSEAIVVMVDDCERLSSQSPENPVTDVSRENLAYVIYTSGSTGQPKGVLVRHGGVSNVIRASIERLGIKPSSRVLQAASLSFDASVLEIFTTLLSGASLFLVDVETLMSNSGLTRLMRDQAITFIASPPSRLDTIKEIDFPDLQTIIVGGESCSVDTAARWSTGRRFFNAYAPTETTIYSTLFDCSELADGPPPVGRPIANTQVYLLDQHWHPVALGVRGELCIGGSGIARGYLNRPELTAEKFIPNPFAKEPGARLYRTGDLARYLPDGNLEFIGRTDQQVKLRGFRIELGEIESALSRHPAVLETAVILREDRPGEKRLVAYLVTKPIVNGERFPNVGEWRSYVKEKLPEYMIPSVFVQLPELPLTANGKTDRRALPAPELSGNEFEETYVEPRTAVEEMLAEIWSQVLGVERVGVRDNFFQLGGHSLLATQLMSRVREDFQIEVELRSLFEFPTVESLAEVITRNRIEQEDSQEMIRLLEALEQMSDEEVGLMEKNRIGGQR